MKFSSWSVMLLLVVCYALWGGGMVAMKYAFESFAVFHVVFARVAFAALFYLALFPDGNICPMKRETGNICCFLSCLNHACSFCVKHFQ